MGELVTVRVKLNLKGINQLMSSAPVQAEIDAVGERIADRAGDGFKYRARTHRWTARGYVQAVTREADKRQADEAVLERALGSQ